MRKGHVFTVGGWTFEIKSIIARKSQVYGEEFSGVANINITDGVLHVEALHCDDFTPKDYRMLHGFICNTLGFETFEYSRYGTDSQRKRVKK